MMSEDDTTHIIIIAQSEYKVKITELSVLMLYDIVTI